MKTCKRIVSLEGFQECGEPATEEFRYHYPARRTYNHNTWNEAEIKGSTPMCDRHAREARAENVNLPDNLIPPDKRWVLLPQFMSAGGALEGAAARFANSGDGTDLRLSAVEYTFEMLDGFLSNMLDAGELHMSMRPVMNDILQVIRKRPGTLPK